MVSKPVTPSQDIRAFSPKLTSREMEEPEPGSESGGKSLPASVVDLEGGYPLEGIQRAGEALSSLNGTGFSMISLSQIVDKIWHFSSVDYGEKCMEQTGFIHST